MAADYLLVTSVTRWSMAYKQNTYRDLGGATLGGHEAMEKLYRPKVVLVRDVMRLSAATIAATFNVVGKHYIEGLRFAMIEEIDKWPGPMCSWKESANRILGVVEHTDLH